MDSRSALRTNDPTRIAGPEPGRDRLRANLRGVLDRIEAARRRGAFPAARVSLVVVTKSVPAAALSRLADAGVTEVGENRVQAAEAKRAAAPPGLVWHGIGHLQTNKARKAVRLFDVFHALDSWPLAERLQSVLEERAEPWRVYLQVNAARDPAKGGIPPEEALDVLARVRGLPRLRVVGLMTMAREEDEGEAARPAFRTLREVRDEALRRGLSGSASLGLSMGMSGDFETAVEEGATVVRIGRAVWEGVTAAGSEDPTAEEDESRGA